MTLRLGVSAVVVILALGSAGCSGSGGPGKEFHGYPLAQATNDCGPAGGAATAVELRPGPGEIDSPGPRLRVTIWRSFGEVAGHSFASGGEPVGAVIEYMSDTENRELPTWSVKFEAAGPDSTLRGELEVADDKGNMRRGTFTATWHPKVVYCI